MRGTLSIAIVAAWLISPGVSQTSTGQKGPSPPLVDIAWVDASTLELSWAAQPGRIFSIQYSDDLSTWKTIGLGNVESFTDEVTGLTRGYYRVSSNAPPELDSIGDQTVPPGETLRFAVTASDSDGDTLSFAASNLPDGAVFEPESGLFGWTPTPGQEGTYVSVRFSVADSGQPQLSDYEDITIIVGEVAPEIAVTWPRGGQFLEAGTVEAIEWVSTGDVGQIVHIDLTPDGGETWYVIREEAANVGYYNWIVPDSWIVPELPSDDCWIAIWSEDESIYGITEDAFSIYDSAYGIGSVYLVAGDGEYLGDCTTNPYVWDSVWNEFGAYGSLTSWTSIWNPAGIYGSDYSDLSPWDPYALDPPYIFINDEYVASLTANYLIWDAIHPDDFFDWVDWIGY